MAQAAALAFLYSGQTDLVAGDDISVSGLSITSSSIATDTDVFVFCQHQHIKNLAYKGVNDDAGVLDDIQKSVARLQFRDNPTIQLGGLALRKSDLTKTDQIWLRRASLLAELKDLVHSGELHDEDYTDFLDQLMPMRAEDLLSPAHFEVFVESVVKENTWCTPGRAIQLLELQNSAEEFHAGPAAQVPMLVSYPPVLFRKLILRNGSNRYQQLANLIKAAVYERKEWGGVLYDDALGEAKQYFTVYELFTVEEVPYHLSGYYRDWSYQEQRLLRSFGLVSNLLQQVNKGTLDFYVFKMIRGALIKLPGQPSMGFDMLERFLYCRHVDAGLKLEDIPKIMILHPKVVADAKPELTCLEDEAQIWKGILATFHRFEEEEEVRMLDLKLAKKAYKKAMGGKSSDAWFNRRANDPTVHRFSNRVKRMVSKVFGKKKEPPPFHCPGCSEDGTRCVKSREVQEGCVGS